MPHKINPKDFENIKSLWKAYMPRFSTVLMDQISEHQRDLTNSASGRYVAEFLAALDYATYRTIKVVKLLEVDHDHLETQYQYDARFDYCRTALYHSWIAWLS